MKILNSSGLDARIEVGTQGSLTASAAPNLPGAVFDQQGVGNFSLNGLLSGIQGSVTVTLVTGVSGTPRTVLFLTDDAVALNNIVYIGLDSSNRPFGAITDNTAIRRGATTPTSAAIAAGKVLTLRLSWDSTQAIDGTRFALLRSEPDTISNWTTNPVAAWASFPLANLIAGQALAGGSDFNGTILSIQASNQTILGATLATPGVLR